MGCLVNATPNKQAKLLTRENFFTRFTTSENLPLLVKTPPKQERQEEEAVYLEHSVSDVLKL